MCKAAGVGRIHLGVVEAVRIGIVQYAKRRDSLVRDGKRIID